MAEGSGSPVRDGTGGGPSGRRARLQARAGALVRANRFTVAVVFPLGGVALFVASHEGLLGPALAYSPVLILAGTLVMRLPLAAGLGPLVDRRAAAGLVVLAGYTYAVELVAVTTGLPYGEFVYGVALGPTLHGGVPLGLPVFYLPLVLDAYLLAVVLLGGDGRSRAARLPAAVAAVLAVDLVLDPAAVALGLWRYAAAGAFHGVPASNFAGWALTGSVAVALVEASFDPERVAARLRDCEFALDDLVSFGLLWGTANLYFGHLLPVAVAAGLLGALAGAGRLDLLAGTPAGTAGGTDRR